MTTTYDAIILGAGIVGAACALECARAGMRVAIVERDAIGSGATAAGMGHIVAMDDSPAQLALTSYSRSLWNQLAPELPASAEYHACGTIWVAADDEEMAEVHRKLDYYAAQGVEAEVLDSNALAEAEPNLVRPLAGGLLVTHDAVLYPPCAAGYLVEQAQQHGATLLLGHAAISATHGQVHLDDGTALQTAIIINATGSLAPALTPGLQIKPRKGHLVITDRYPGYLHHQLVELGYLKSAHSSTSDSVAFNVQPRKTGQLLIGSSRQFNSNSEDKRVDHTIVAAMIERAALYMPGLRFSLRPAHLDRLPRGHARQAPSHRPDGRPHRLSRHRARRSRHHHLAGHGAAAGRSSARAPLSNSTRSLPAIPPSRRGTPCLNDEA